jgi:hypothetical protein
VDLTYLSVSAIVKGIFFVHITTLIKVFIWYGPTSWLPKGENMCMEGRLLNIALIALKG